MKRKKKIKTNKELREEFKFTFYNDPTSLRVMYRWRDSGNWKDSNSSKNVMEASVDDIWKFIHKRL